MAQEVSFPSSPLPPPGWKWFYDRSWNVSTLLQGGNVVFSHRFFLYAFSYQIGEAKIATLVPRPPSKKLRYSAVIRLKAIENAGMIRGEIDRHAL